MIIYTCIHYKKGPYLRTLAGTTQSLVKVLKLCQEVFNPVKSGTEVVTYSSKQINLYG